MKYKYSMQYFYFETLVLALYCYCGDNVKYGLLSKHLFKENNKMTVEKIRSFTSRKG